MDTQQCHGHSPFYYSLCISIIKESKQILVGMWMQCKVLVNLDPCLFVLHWNIRDIQNSCPHSLKNIANPTWLYWMMAESSCSQKCWAFQWALVYWSAVDPCCPKGFPPAWRWACLAYWFPNYCEATPDYKPFTKVYHDACTVNRQIFQHATRLCCNKSNHLSGEQCTEWPVCSVDSFRKASSRPQLEVKIRSFKLKRDN